MLDLCTGNGSLAVLAALAWPEVDVDAADVSADALEVARINVDRHGLGERITLPEVDRFAACRGALRPDPVQPALRQRGVAWPRCRPNTAPSRRSRWPAAPTAWTSCARCCATRRPHMNDDAVLVLEIGNERAHFERAFPRLEAVWLDTSAGDDQVLLHSRALAAGRCSGRSPPTAHDHACRSQSSPLRRGAKVVLQTAQASPLHPGEKVGLVGRNGAGKSTLFALLAGRLHADAGDVAMPPRWRIAEVAQDMPETDEGATDFVLEGDMRADARRRPSSPRPRPADDGHAIARGAPRDQRGRRLRRAAARAGAAARPRLQARRSSTRRSTASPAAGACGCSWRAR